MSEIHPSFALKQSKGNDWYFNIMASNGKILATSEMYKSKASAESGIKSVIDNIYNPFIQDNTPSVPKRSGIGVRLSTMKRLGIESMIDVANALQDGRLKIDE